MFTRRIDEFFLDSMTIKKLKNSSAALREAAEFYSRSNKYYSLNFITFLSQTPETLYTQEAKGLNARIDLIKANGTLV